MARDDRLDKILEDAVKGNGRITVLTGAGISAESGIPTFRGPEGYWTVGSEVYQPMEMGTLRMFRKDPEAVWVWYLYRMGVCRAAAPNAGHRAVVEMERLLGDRFTLITQNVDNLHLRAGNSPERTLQIHGNVFFMRCAAECTQDIFPLPEGAAPKQRGDALTDAERDLLKCPVCGGLSRPHVLWFDEMYNEVHFRLESAMKAALETALLIVVGTAGATTLPNRVAMAVLHAGGVIIDVNPEKNPFSEMALAGGRGLFLKGKSGEVLPGIVSTIARFPGR